MNSRPVFFRISRNRKKAASAPAMRPKALSGSIAKYSRGLVLSALALIGASQAPGATYYWDTDGTGTAGAGATPTGTWGTSLFWTTDPTGANVGSPVLTATTTNADDLNFVAGPSATSGNNAYTVTVDGSQVANTLNFQASGATTISGGTLITVGNGTSGNGGINIPQFAYGSTNNGAVTISTAVTLNNTQTWTNNSANTLTVNTGALAIGSNTLTIGGSGNTTLSSSSITGSNIAKIGAGTLTITTAGASNTYTGTTTVSNGTLLLNSSGTIAAKGGTTVAAGGKLQLQGGVTFGDALTISGLNAVSATGGTVTTDGTFEIHTFTGSGTLSVSTGGSLQYLVVGGGGGGGNTIGGWTAGGGGAGGFLTGTTFASSGSASVTVGAGGSGGTTGKTGENSVFLSFTAIGGGAGGVRTGSGAGTGGTGGSGGGTGGDVSNTAGGLGTAGQGNNGAARVSPTQSGGGGGAGQAGQGANGGNGLQSNITGTNVYYAGGGGGGAENATPGNGGLGGGGLGNSSAGSDGLVGYNGVNGTGGGGGGAGGPSGNNNGGSGGSGIVIVRFNTVNVTPLDNVSGNNTLTGAITLASDVGINSVQDTLTLSGAIGDSGSGFFINKLGAGTVALSGANTYTGLTLVTAGTLQLGSGSTTGSLHTSSAISVLSGATFAVNRSNTVTQGTQFSGAAITGAGNFAQAGAGTTVLTAANSYTGTTTVSAGTLQLGSGSTTGSLSTSSAISVASGATFAVNRSNTVTQGTDFSGSAITGAGNFAQTGAGTTALTAANAYTGTTTISAGTLQLGNFGTTSTTGSLSPSSAITNNANLVFNRTDTVTQGTHFASVIAGTGTVTQAGNGTVELNGANTYAGVTTVSFAGKLNIQNSSALGTTNGGTTVAPGGKLQLQNNITVAGETLSLGTTNFGTAIQSATGGTLSSLTIGTATYELHTFTTTGTTSLNVNVATTAEYLVVAGGGAGGAASSGNSSYMPGGGGAGGMKTGTGYSLAVANYSITVGAGGSTAGANGGNSVFDTITSTGGGGGGSGNSGSFTSGVNGGSGGGGAAANGPVNNGGTGIAGQGNAGGGGAGGANYGGGGGGGAGSVGGNATGTVAGSGGSGSSSSITGSSVTYAAGGGGAIESGGTVGAGGSSGLGGTGGNQSTVATSAAANTGSGGGGQGATGSIGAGGSGIVIVRLAQVYGLSASLENVSGNNSWSGAITLTGSTVGISSLQDTLTLSGAIGDSGSGFGMTKLGAGTVALGGANTYTGATTITAGTLQLGSGSTTGSLNTSSAISVASGATFAVNRSDTVTQGTQFSGAAITGAGNFAQTGAGTTVLTAANTYTGTTTVSAGTLQFAKQVSLYNNGAAAAWSKTNINVNSGATMAFNIGGSGEFTNANIVSLLGLADATTNGFKTGAILGLDTTSGDVLFNSVIANPNGGANALGLTKLGTNKLTIDQANTYTGVTTVSNGTLKLNGAGVNTTILTDNNTATTSDIVINGGTLELAASEQIRNTGSINMTSGAFNFGAATGKIETIDKFTNSGGTFTTGANTLIGLGHTITWSGGTNTISNLGLVQDVHIVISGGTNTVQGGANGGVLELLALTQAGDGLEMSAGSTLTLNSDNAVAGKLKLSGDVSTSGNSTVTIASAPGGANPGNIDLNSGTRTFTVADGLAATDMSISARITNTGSIIKDGAGTLSLDAANNYSGTTSINNGTLIANVLGALPITPRSAVSFTGGGNPTLSLGANQVAASLNSVGATTGTVTLGSSNLTVGAASGTTDFKGSIGGAGNLIKDDASIQVISGTSNNTFTGTTTVSGGTLEVQGSLSGTTAVTVNTSGTLLLNSAASPIINTAATMTVGNSGTVKIDNSLSTTNQTFASLTLTHTPILDFGTGTSNAMTFSSLTFTATKLNVYNWSGSAYGAGVADGGNLTDGQDRLLFNADTIFIGTSDNRIEFFADNGITSLGFGQEVAFGSQFELVPITAVPEPATTALIGSIALCALIGYRERRRFTGFGKRTAARK